MTPWISLQVRAGWGAMTLVLDSYGFPQTIRAVVWISGVNKMLGWMISLGKLQLYDLFHLRMRKMFVVILVGQIHATPIKIPTIN